MGETFRRLSPDSLVCLPDSADLRGPKGKRDAMSSFIKDYLFDLGNQERALRDALEYLGIERPLRGRGVKSMSSK